MSEIDLSVTPQWPEGMTSTGDVSALRAKASLLSNTAKSCPTFLAEQLRPGIWPEVEKWRPRQPELLGFFFGRIYDAIVAIEDGSTLELVLKDILAEERKNEGPVHPLVASYVRHAVATYIDVSRTRNQELELTPTSDRKIEVIRPKEVGREVSAWGAWYATDDGLYREFRRLRMGSARPADEQSLRFAACAAKLLVDGRDGDRSAKHIPDTVAVVEVGLVDGSVTTIWEGTSIEARALYDEMFRPVISEVLAAPLELRPGWDCGKCGWRAGCPAIPQLRGVLGLPKMALTTRHVSASDLGEYARCPARYAMRVGHVPGSGDDTATSVQRRGLSVHCWLEAAHKRGVGCTDQDLPDPRYGATDPLSVLDPAAYADVWPYLLAHLATCPLDDPALSDVETEPRIRAWDADADVLVVAGPDLRWKVDSLPVWRETKTVIQRPPQTPHDALHRWPQVALDLVLLADGIDGGRGLRPDVAIAVLEVECLTDRGAELIILETADEHLVAKARHIVAEAAYAWSQDNEFKTQPGPHCQSCKAVRWCDQAETPTPTVVVVDEVDDDFETTVDDFPQEPPY